MVTNPYVPDRRDVVWLEFNPQLGHEQRGRRPALVLSYKRYNEKTGLGIFCPITSKEKGYPFEVKLEGTIIRGSVLSDQVKNLDWRIRNIEFIELCEKDVIAEVVENLKLIIGSE